MARRPALRPFPVRRGGPLLKFEDTASAAEIGGLAALGGLPGVFVELAAGLNGPGWGRLVFDDGWLSWAPPPAGRPTGGTPVPQGLGLAVDVSAGGTFYLTGPTAGDGRDQYLRVIVGATDLPDALAEAAIELRETAPRLDLGGGVTGPVGQELTLRPRDALALAGGLLYFDARTRDVEYSLDGGGSWWAPRDAATAAAGAGSFTIAGGGTTVRVRQVIAGSDGKAGLPLGLYCEFDDGAGGRGRALLRGSLHRAATAAYDIFLGTSSPDVQADTPAHSGATPAWTSGSLPNGANYATVVYRSAYGLRSPPARVDRFQISSSARVLSPAVGPHLSGGLEHRGGGVMRVLAQCSPAAADAATIWALRWTFTGVDPQIADPVNAEVAMNFEAVAALLRYDLPAQAAGTTVKVLITTRQASGALDSEDLLRLTAVVPSTMAAPPRGGSS